MSDAKGIGIILVIALGVAGLVWLSGPWGQGWIERAWEREKIATAQVHATATAEAKRLGIVEKKP